MRHLIAGFVFLGLASFGMQVQAHGGGCRKSSPPGQCCHMEKAKGRVHCH